ncbi:MAG: DNA replication/repair protein RecF [Marinicella sp.]
MFIKQLKINGFRCYESVDLMFEKKINVFIGPNGSGKTSVLEAIYYLSTGKSFRSKKNKVLVNNLQNQFTLFCQFSETEGRTQNLGVSFNKNTGQKQIKLNQNQVKNQSEIAHMIPVVAIDPESYLFIDKGPQYRRSFLDWLVFHVKPEYLQVWTQTMRCQKQLNASYKSQYNQTTTHWEQQYILQANQLNDLRRVFFKQLEILVMEKVSMFLPEVNNFCIHYFQGWSKENDLTEQIKKDREKNLNYGSLYSGVHKMDIKCRVNNSQAQDVLSRGQKKIISIIFNLCFIEMLTAATKLNPIVCFDDLDAELDGVKTNLLCDFINNSQNQIFLSTVDLEKVTSLLNEFSVFHVKPTGIDV